MVTRLVLSGKDTVVVSDKAFLVAPTSQLTEVNPIIINQNSDWAALSGNSWFQGSGIWGDPYIISNLTISTKPEPCCISINNTDVYFIIQNCELIVVSGTEGRWIGGIFLQNVENGLIYNSKFYNSYSGLFCIRLTDCYNVTVVKNTAIEAPFGVSLWSCEKINVSNNIVIDAMCGISLNDSNNCSIWRNEIRVTSNYPGYKHYNVGVGLTNSSYNVITENNFYCVAEPISEFMCYGNVIENNSFHYCDFYNPETALNIELLIASALLISSIVLLTVVIRKTPRRKKAIGIASISLNCVIMGLLGHGIYNIGLVPWWIAIYSWLGVIAIFGCNLILLRYGIKAIRKPVSGSQYM